MTAGWRLSCAHIFRHMSRLGVAGIDLLGQHWSVKMPNQHELIKIAEKQGVFESIISSVTLASAHREELNPNRANQLKGKPN